MSFEPTEEQKRAYIEAQRNKNSVLIWPLADLAQHAMAAALKLNNELVHDNLGRGPLNLHLHGADHVECLRDEWKEADWLRLADEKLREVKR